MNDYKEIKDIYDIPYEKIPFGSKVIVYGAGKVGESYIRKIQSDNHCELVAVVDSKCVGTMYGTEIEISTPEEISILQYDFILIAVENYDVMCDIKQFLIDAGVNKSKIIWNGTKNIDLKMKQIWEYKKFLNRNLEGRKQRCFLFMLPEHGNAGDYAIGEAEKLFLNKYFPHYEVVTVTTVEWLYAKREIANLVTEDDIIFLNGGGYIGNLWEDTENYKSVVERFPQNVKFFFPNTLTYQNEFYEVYQPFIDEMRWFAKQKKLYTMFRDRNSYLYFKKYDTRGYYFPDMVLLTHFSRKDYESKSVVGLCFRKDRERTFGNIDILKEKLQKNNIRYEEFDIHAGRYVSQQNGHAFVEAICKKMQRYDCILTDRLHGMLLSVISDVPCLAFDNLTHKVSGVYEWIRDRQYVTMCLTEDNLDDINEKIINEIKRKSYVGEFIPLTEQFEKMAAEISRCIRRDNYTKG